MSARISAACGSASDIPARRSWSTATCSTISPSADREWIDPLLAAIADNAALLAKGDDANFMNRVHLATADEDEPAPPERPRRREGQSGARAGGAGTQGRRRLCRAEKALRPRAFRIAVFCHTADRHSRSLDLETRKHNNTGHNQVSIDEERHHHLARRGCAPRAHRGGASRQKPLPLHCRPPLRERRREAAPPKPSAGGDRALPERA